MPLTGDPTKPCPNDSLNGYHEWVSVQQSGTGDGLPGARECLNCGAFDYGPLDHILNHKDSPHPVFPAGTRSYRIIKTHNPDDPSPIHHPGEEVN